MEKAVLDVATNLRHIRLLVSQAAQGRSVRLIAVSKTKPVELLRQVYQEDFLDFGENYVEEIVQKSKEMPAEVRWHFIGHLQSNKAKAVCSIPNLYSIHTLDSIRLADKIHKALLSAGREQPLQVYIQIKTSQEDSKHGISPESPELDALVSHLAGLPSLRLVGLMTIGQAGDLEAFSRMRLLRDQLVARHSLEALELSMGMSADYQEAITQGSDNVRVGSSIFGARNYAK